MCWAEAGSRLSTYLPVNNIDKPRYPVFMAGACLSRDLITCQVAPYVPRRVLARLLRAQTAPPPPPQLPVLQELCAAVLFVDVSGFTKLSVEFCRRGAHGCEEVSGPP